MKYNLFVFFPLLQTVNHDLFTFFLFLAKVSKDFMIIFFCGVVLRFTQNYALIMRIELHRRDRSTELYLILNYNNILVFVIEIDGN
jgi:hypothetical protein